MATCVRRIKLRQRPIFAQVLKEAKSLSGEDRNKFDVSLVRSEMQERIETGYINYKKQLYATRFIEYWETSFLNGLYSFTVGFCFAWVSEELTSLMKEAKGRLSSEEEIIKFNWHIKHLSQNRAVVDIPNSPQECYLAELDGAMIAPVEVKPYWEAFNKIIKLYADEESKEGFWMVYSDELEKNDSPE